MRRPLHSHRAQNRFKPGEPIPEHAHHVAWTSATLLEADRCVKARLPGLPSDQPWFSGGSDVPVFETRGNKEQSRV